MKSAISTALAMFFLAGCVGAAKAASTAVLTHHYDIYRTGWNQTETTLTPANVGSPQFGLLAVTLLDSQVDAQPLVMPNQTITGGANPGTYDVVYVATEANTVYAINAANGQVLTSRNFGPAVPYPLGCINNAPTVGITSTPVIDTINKTLDLIAYTLVGGVPTYTLHALNLGDLTDKIAPVTVAASNQLSDGTTYNFNAQYQRQRAALLHANGAIYAGFASFCDFSPATTRGWLLGWNASTLMPFTANRLNDTLPPSASPHNYFLSSIWMSGSGPAADLFGNIYFVTGNTDFSGTTYNPVTNIANTVAKVSGNLIQILSKFTPANEALLDVEDADFGSGGVLLVPGQSGPIPRLAVAGGKDGNMYLFDRDLLGSLAVGGPNYVLDLKPIGSCWCAESYFTGPDGIGRVVSSGSLGVGDNPYNAAAITTWQLQTSPAPKLVREGTAAPVASGQDGGTFTTVSSNGTQAGTGIIWTVARPSPAVPDAAVILYAFAATPNSGKLHSLFGGVAGVWPFTAGDANIVPVVANGKVFVAAYGTLAIFGLRSGGAASKPLKIIPSTLTAGLSAPGANEAPHEITGTLLEINGSALSIKTRAGNTVMVDATKAAQAQRSAVLVIGKAFSVQGTYDANGKLLATIIVRAKPSAGSWPRDR